MGHDHLILRSLLVPVRDLAESVRFYQEQLGLSLVFQDGERYAELTAGSLKFALATPEDHPAPTSVLPTFKTADVQQTVERLCVNGATVGVPPREGPHEIRAVVRDPAGIPFAVYASRR